MRFIIGLMIAIILVAGVGAFYIWPRIQRAPENAQTSLIEAQRLIGLLKRVEEAAKLSGQSQGFIEASATKKKGRFQYSESWEKFNFPPVRENLGYNFRCSADGMCRAMEVKGDMETGNGIGCEIESGEYQCYGEFKPVTTRGFDGSDIIIGCKAP